MSNNALRKVYWHGKHKSLKDSYNRPLISPLGRLPLKVLEWLCQSYGWKEISIDETITPVFSFCGRKSGDFSDLGTLICQLPSQFYHHVDCKLKLYQHLKESKKLDLIPPSYSFNEFTHTSWTNTVHTDIYLWYVKHRYGVKGKSIYLFTCKQAVIEWLSQRANNDYVIQREVKPHLIQGKKYTIRAHVLIKTNPETLYVHRRCICNIQQKKYNEDVLDKAAHISSFGIQEYFLLEDDETLYNMVWQQLVNSVKEVHEALRWYLIPSDTSQTFYHLFGYDYIVDIQHKVKLLEINANPAIASGTMSHIPDVVYVKLLQDLVKEVVLPISDHLVLENDFFRVPLS